MTKKIVGIVPTIHLNVDDDPFQDRYQFVNKYIKRIFEADAIPVGILLNDGELDYNTLSICDAILIPGGTKIDKMHYQVIDYAYKNNKPLLGICMGMQAINTYLLLKEECFNRGIDYYNEDERKKLYDEVKVSNPFLKITEGSEYDCHFHVINRTNLETSFHDIYVEKDTFLYEVYDSDVVTIPSLHRVVVNRISNDVEVMARSEDGIIEAINVIDKDIYGVQYHPELLDNDNLIKKFVKRI